MEENFWLVALLISVTYFGFVLGKVVELNNQLRGEKMDLTADRILALKIEPSGETEIVDMSGNEVIVLQEGVGGWIEGISLTMNAMMWCNEEGIAEGLERNPWAEMIYDAYLDRKNPILGTVMMTGGCDEFGELCSLTRKQIERLTTDIKFVKVIEPLKGKN